MSGANDWTLLGHKPKIMILRYAHLGPTHLWNAVEGLSKFSRRGIGTDTKGIPSEGQNSQVLDKKWRHQPDLHRCYRRESVTRWVSMVCDQLLLILKTMIHINK